MYNRLLGGWSNRDPISPVPASGDFHNWDGSFPEPVWGERYDMSGVGTTTQSAIYAATRFQILDQLKLIAGGRLSNWRRKEEVAAYTPAPFTLKFTNEFTPYVGLVYDLTDQVSA